jgi:hypothetical protein
MISDKPYQLVVEICPGNLRIITTYSPNELHRIDCRKRRIGDCQ